MKAARIADDPGPAAGGTRRARHAENGNHRPRAARWALFGYIVLAGMLPVVRAHDPGLSTAQGQLRGGLLELTTGFAPADVRQLVPAAGSLPDQWTPEDLEPVRDALNALATELWEFKVGGAAVAPSESRVELEDGDSLNFHLVFPLTGGDFTLRARKIGQLPGGHRCFLILVDERGARVASKLLGAHDDTLAAGAAAAAPGGSVEVTPGPASPTAFEFVRLGIEHIWMGYDHLLFLFGLLVVCRRFVTTVAVISCFTVAHSVTLALATFDLVNLPGWLVEPAIAASIVYVGVENLVRRGEEPRGRWALTFVFGLIHGFGFAGVLRELGVGGGGTGIAMPLFTFNLGVELGQIAIAVVALPIIWQLRRNDTFTRRGVPALSAAVALAGLYWLLERTVLA